MIRRVLGRLLAVSVAAGFAGTGLVVTSAAPAHAASQIVGSGSSFAGIELGQWQAQVGVAPYNINVNYQSSSSGQGRQDFFDNSVDFAVSDIRYDPLDDGTNIPNTSDFAYIPVTAGGISFMYNLQNQGFNQTAKPIQLSSLTVCGIFGDAIQYWDDPALKADNPGVNLPHVAITPVVRGDAAGTNYVLEEYCLATQPALYQRFINAWNSSSIVKGGGGAASPTNAPTSIWPPFPPITDAQGSDGVANLVADQNSNGYIGAVETGYAIKLHFPVASVQNDTGQYLQPTAAAVAQALGHASQLNDGTQQLNFTPGDPAAYNPSTYSYMLVRISSTGADSRPTSVGAQITAFANYCLTIGQEEAPNLGYASINRSLITFALQRLQVVPGWVGPTQDEQNAIPTTNANTNPTTIPSTIPPASSSALPSNIGGGTASTAGSTGSTSGSSGATAATTSGGGTTASTTHSSSSSTATSPGSSSVASTTGSNSASSGSGGTTNAALAAVNPSASLGTSGGAMAQTGIETDLVVAVGLALVVGGEFERRRRLRRREA